VSDVPSADGVLGSVRQLEQALEATATTKAASERRLAEARDEASRRIAAARDEAAAAAAERRRVALAAVDSEAAGIVRRGAETATGLRADADAARAGLVEVALALILPGDGNGEG
jgi:vacuolar-type H+-ATPase subunit H